MNDKLDARTKWSYCIGATGRDAAYALVSMYLILYVQYTMNLSSVQFAVISAAMIVCMVWDAVNDLLMGIIIENTHFRMGKFKPWILIGSISNAVVIIGLGFWHNRQISQQKDAQGFPRASDVVF